MLTFLSNSQKALHSCYTHLLVLSFLGLSSLATNVPALAQNSQEVTGNSSGFPDVDSDNWAAESLQNLNGRYECLQGFPDGTFRGDEPLTRYQFVAGFEACMSNYDAQLQDRIGELVTKEDLAILFRALSTLFERNGASGANSESGNPLLPNTDNSDQ
jgi:hypothetical protein